MQGGLHAEDIVGQISSCMIAKGSFDFYGSKRWKAIREKALRRDGYKCQLSWRYGKMRQAEVVHHIFPRDEFPEYQYSLWNLISLTREKHNTLHDRNTDELTEAGKELLRKTARKNGIPIPSRYE